MAPPELLEREADLAALIGAVTVLAAEGTGGVVLIEGLPGIGKTALLNAALDAAGAANVAVLRGRGSELEAVLAFGGVRQLFGGAVLELSETERNGVFAGPAGLARPVLGLQAGDGADGTLGDPLYGLFWLAVELSERAPLVLAIDDLHWLDDESGRFAAYLADRIEGVPILMLATARPDEPGAAHSVVASLGEGGTVIRPQPLSERSVNRLLHDPTGSSAFLATGGNPLFVTELGRALAAAPGTPVDEVGPVSIAKLVLTRVQRVSPEAAALARAVAVFAEGASLADAAAVASLDLDTAAHAADGLITAQVLADGEPLRFVHPVMRRAVYDELGSFARRRAHERAATLLKARGAAADAVASHLLASEPSGDPDDQRILVEAADEAEARRALGAAARYLKRALAEPGGEPEDHAALLGRLGRLQAVLAHPDRLETLRAAVAETEDVAERLDLAVVLGKVAHDHEPAVGLSEMTNLRASTELDPQRALAVDSLIAGCAHRILDLPAFKAAVGRLPRDLAGGTEHERLALSILAWNSFLEGEPAAVVRDLVLRSVGDAPFVDVDVGSDVDDSVDLLCFCGDLDAAVAFSQERIARARENGSTAAYASAQVTLSDAAFIGGDLLEAEATARFGIGAAPSPHALEHCRGRLLSVLVAQGRLDEAEALAPEMTVNYWEFAMMALQRGDAPAAVAGFEDVDTFFDGYGMQSAAGRLYTQDYADALAAVGRADEALELMREYLIAAERFDETRVLGVAHLGLGRHTAGAAGREHLEHAHELLDGSPYRLDAARARLDLGARLRRDGERVAARELMLPALQYAERQQAAPLSARLREELKLVGSRPRSAVRTGVDALTPSELRIARLAAGGMTNKQIAQDLFLTIKTVETHLGGAFRKLDVSSRRDLPDALSDGSTRS
jgi:DNA-binding CsgD family transcriptional regulator